MPESFDRPVDKRSYRAAKEQLVRLITTTYTPPFAMYAKRLEAYRLISRKDVQLILDSGLLYDGDPYPIGLEIEAEVELRTNKEVVRIEGSIPPAVVMSRLLQMEPMDRIPIANRLVLREHQEILALLRADDLVSPEDEVHEELKMLQALYDKIVAGKAV